MSGAGGVGSRVADAAAGPRVRGPSRPAPGVRTEARWFASHRATAASALLAAVRLMTRMTRMTRTNGDSEAANRRVTRRAHAATYTGYRVQSSHHSPDSPASVAFRPGTRPGVPGAQPVADSAAVRLLQTDVAHRSMP